MQKVIILLSCLWLAACSTGSSPAPELSPEEQAANRGYVKAALLQNENKLDQAYDACQVVIASLPASLAGRLCAKKVAELKPLVIIYGVKKDTLKYPQSTYQAYINSVIAAMDANDYPYLFIHLASIHPISKRSLKRALERVDAEDMQQKMQQIRQGLMALQGVDGDINQHPAYVEANKRNTYTEHKFYIESEYFELYEANGAFYLQR